MEVAKTLACNNKATSTAVKKIYSPGLGRELQISLIFQFATFNQATNMAVKSFIVQALDITFDEGFSPGVNGQIRTFYLQITSRVFYHCATGHKPLTFRPLGVNLKKTASSCLIRERAFTTPR